MQPSVRHFVRRILGIHLLLLALLLAVVTMASRHVYQSARAQAIQQSEDRQKLMVSEAEERRKQQIESRKTLLAAQAAGKMRLMASQTAHGIGGFYKAILSDMNLLKPSEEEEPDLPDVVPVDPRAYQNKAVVRQLVRQLQGRARLFLVNEQMRAIDIDNDMPIHALAQAAHDARHGILPTTSPADTLEQRITVRFTPWLKTIRTGGSISGLELFTEKDGSTKGIKLVAVPMMLTPKGPVGSKIAVGPRHSGWLVAEVPAGPVERQFLTDLGQHDVSGAFLVDESLAIMAASRHELLGARLDRQPDPPFESVIASFKKGDYAAQSIYTPFHINGEQFDPAMIAAERVDVLDKRWIVVICAPLKALISDQMTDLLSPTTTSASSAPIKEVDSVVKQLWSKALFWAIFVAVSMTAIFVSTAAQLIMSRVRMERARHKSLQNEMRQARQIQLAWLPQKTKTLCSAAMLDIASLNRPATHISGDFYNFFELPDGRTAVIIGDVTGHGTAAAFLMATAQLLVRNTLPQYCDPGRCMEDVNRQLSNQMFNGQFVTMQILAIDSRSGEVDIATAGHPAPLIGDGQSFHLLKIEPQLVVGVDASTRYPTERFRLRPNNSILLYTDGVVETENPAGNCLRLEGLRQALSGTIENAEALLQKAVSAVNTFRRGQELRDDLTMVAVHLLPDPQPAPHPISLPAAPKALPVAQLK